MKNLIFSAFLIVSVIVTGCATSDHVLTAKPRPSFSPEAVQVYSVAPTNAEILGTVSVNVPSGFNHYINHPEIDDLKKEAAKIGANGIVPSEGGMKVFVGFQQSAVAIFVP